MFAYRIADVRHPIFDATGAMLHGGRWNSIGRRVIYAAETYSGALLEVLVHANLSRPPKNHRAIRIHIPDEMAIESVTTDQLARWDCEDMLESQALGDTWIDSKRTAALRVPSVVTQGRENNLILNVDHPQFALITVEPPEQVHWDERLFHRHLSPPK